jgi:hypothetical protein
MQPEDQHDTPVGEDRIFGVCCLTHFDPFKPIANQLSEKVLVPTASHLDADSQATPSSEPGGLPFADCSAHFLPFQSSVSGKVVPPLPLPRCPTATHLTEDVHVIAWRELSADLGMFAAVAFHILPFHSQAAASPGASSPAAMQNVADVHEMP